MNSPSSKTIEIIVAPDGKSRVETLGFVGAACREASQFIEQALGKRTGEQLKSEFHQSVSSQQQIHQGE